MKTYKRIETQLIHAGTPQPRILGAVSLPIFQSANFEYAGESRYDDLKYIRLNNTPNHVALHRTLATARARAGRSGCGQRHGHHRRRLC